VTIYVLRNGVLVEKDSAPPARGVSVWSDLAAYKSPLGTGVIEGRYARREDLKRGNCREVDPSEFKPGYTNPRYVEKLRRLGHLKD
jgi:hypothetical protein